MTRAYKNLNPVVGWVKEGCVVAWLRWGLKISPVRLKYWQINLNDLSDQTSNFAWEKEGDPRRSKISQKSSNFSYEKKNLPISSCNQIWARFMHLAGVNPIKNLVLIKTKFMDMYYD